MITAAVLRAICGDVPQAERVAAALQEAADRWYINTPARLEMWLAQLAHESNRFRATVENLNYSAAALARTWPKQFADSHGDGRPGMLALQIERQPELIANTVYGGRMGNGPPESGDGWRYRGRGYIQLTGRNNYHAYSMSRFNDARLLTSPDDAASLPLAADVAGWFWRARGCNRPADAGDIEECTRLINGGLNGIADRRQFWERAKAALAGASEQPPAPIIDHSFTASAPPPAEQESSTMAPIIPILSAVLPVLQQAAPALGRLFGSGSEVAERNTAAAQVVLDIATQATDAVNAQQAAERIAQDPAAAQAFRDAVEQQWFSLVEAGGGGIAGARESAAQVAAGSVPFWRQPVFIVTLALLPLVYMVAAAVLFGDGWSTEIRASVVSALITGALGSIGGYWLGTSASSARKDDALINRKG